jgi:hypothetical protein
MFSRNVLASATLTLSVLTTFTSAQTYPNQTAPFQLKIISYDNSTLNGSSVYACHEGAAIEGICNQGQLTSVPTSASTFTFNYTDGQVVDDPSIGVPGYLTYLLQASAVNVSEPLELTLLESSNIAHPIFTPSETGSQVAFDSKDLLNVRLIFIYTWSLTDQVKQIQSYVDDMVYPPQAGSPKAYYRWYLCTTYYSSYTYETLNWVLGSFPPQNPSCQKVDVKREYI